MDAYSLNYTEYGKPWNQTFPRNDCSLHHFGTYFGITLVAVFVTVGLIGNSIVFIVLLCASRNLASGLAPATISYVISLALSDLFTCLTVMPFDIVYWLNFPIWPLRPSICKLWNSLFYTFHASASFGIAAISLDTYKTVATPFKGHENQGKCSSKLVICMIWLWSIAVGIMIYFLQQEPPVGEYLFEINSIAYGCYLLIHFIIPQILAAGCYFKLYHIAKEHAITIRNLSISTASTTSSESKSSQGLSFTEEFRLARTFLLVTIGYFLCWNPFLIVQFVYVLKQESKFDWCSLETADTVLCWLAYFQCCINPFIYALRKKYFKELFKRAVRPM